MEDENILITSDGSSEEPNLHTSGGVISSVYSGADIKLVVHLPPPEDSEQNTELAEAEAQLDLVQQQIESATSEEGNTQLQNRLDEIRVQLDSLTTQLLATEPGSSESEAIEQQIVALEEERDSIESQLQAGSSAAGSVEELRTQEAQLTEQIEILREEGAISQTQTKTLAEVTTLSISTHREKYQVRTLGSVYPRSVTRGPRCLPASEKVLIRDRGYISIADVRPGDYVQSSDSTYDRVSGSWRQGKKECYELILENGYSLKGSYDHPVSTPEGWVNISDLEEGDLVDVVARTPVSQGDYPIDDDCLKMIAYLIGDGQVQKYNNTHVVALSIADKEMSSIGEEVHRCLENLDISYRDSRKETDACIRRAISVCKKGKGETDWHQREYNDLHALLLRFGMYGRYSHQKEIPQEFLYGLSKRQIILFLRRLFATDGCYSISHDSNRKYVEAKYTSTSEELIDQIRLLLSKIGISSIKNRNSRLAGQIGGRPDIISRHNVHTLVISSAFDLLRFYSRVGIFGKDDRLEPLVPILKRRIRSHYLPIGVKRFRLKVKDILLSRNEELREFCSKHNLYAYWRELTPRWAFRIADSLGSPELLEYVDEVTSDLLESEEEYVSRKVRGKRRLGYLPVYDLEVENRHAFIANFVRVHNTISGSIVFTTFYEHIFHDFFGAASVRSTGVGDWDRYRWTSYITDQLPPMDISIVFANEYGNLSWMALLGVEFVNEGMVMSIEDLFVEGTTQYIARDFDPIRGVAQRGLQRNRGVGAALTGSDLLAQDLQLRAGGRRNPFL
jgi:intein/homing endonuclease